MKKIAQRLNELLDDSTAHRLFFDKLLNILLLPCFILFSAVEWQN